MDLSLSTSTRDIEAMLTPTGELTCDGVLPGGERWQITVGELQVESGRTWKNPTPAQRTEVLDLLRAKLKGGRVEEDPSGKILFIKNKPTPPTPSALGGLISGVRKRAREALGVKEQEVRGLGMVSWVRRTSEEDPSLSGTALEDLLKTEFEDDLKDVDDLDLFAKEAVKLARNAGKNTESAKRVVIRTGLVREVAIRLGKAQEESRIRTDLSADANFNSFRSRKGKIIERSPREIKEILDIALAEAKVLRAEKAKEKAGSLNLKARELGMVSMARYMMEDFGERETLVRLELTTKFAGEPKLADLVDAAIREAGNDGHNKNAAWVVAMKMDLDAEVAKRLAKGEDENDIRYHIRSSVEEFAPGLNRSEAEKDQIWDAALAEGKKLEAKTKHNTSALVEAAHKDGLVVAARREIAGGATPESVGIQLVINFPGGNAKKLAEVAVREALDNEKYKLRLDRYVKEQKLGERVLNARDASMSDILIEGELKNDYKDFVVGGTAIERSPADLDEIVAAAFRQADALGRLRTAEAQRKRKESHSKTKRAAMIPGSLEGTWEKKMTNDGTFRLVRLRREEGKTEDEIRTEVEGLFAGEHDPEAMAVYVMEQVEDPAFNRKQAEQLVFLRGLDQIAKEFIKPDKKDEDLKNEVRAKLESDPKKHLGLKSGEKIEDALSNEELDEIIQAAIRKAKNVKEWEDNGEQAKTWLKGPGWEFAKKSAKVGAVGTAVLGLGIPALGLVASAAALTLGWKGLKLGWRGLETAAAYGLPMMGEAARAGVNVAGATLKFARNTLLYAPASMIATPMVRTYQAARVAVNYPDQANYQKPEIKKPANKEAKGWTTPFTWMANGFRSTTTGIGNLFRRTTTGTANLFRGGWRKTKQAGLLAAALLTAPVVGLGEGTAIGVGHHIAGAEWHGSQTIDAFMEENGKPHAAPAANGNGHAKPHAKAH